MALIWLLGWMNKKHMSCKCKCKFDGRKYNWNNDKCQCECKNPKVNNAYNKDYILNPATCSFKNGKYVGSIIDDLLITWDEIIDTTKTVPINIYGKGNL